ncbi:PH domain-containing protein [Candidatus Bathyarchaeota archaeon]|nr:PH domain-containing protein [Candidatus Bathyarchaeota archaeon]
MRPFQQIIIPSILTVFMGLILFFFNIQYELLPNSPITLVLPILAGIIGTYAYFGFIHRTGLNLSGKEILVVGLLTTIIWTLVWTGFSSMIWGYDTVAVIANIVMGFPTYTVGVFLGNIILKQIPRKPDTTTLLPQMFNQLGTDEKMLWNGNPAFISSLIPSARWIISIPNTVAFIIVGLIGLYSLLTRGDIIGILFFIGSVSYALIILSLVLIRIIYTMRKRIEYILTNQRLVIQMGNEKTESVELKKIRSIRIRNGPFDDVLERVFKVSTIVVRTAEDSPRSLAFTYLKEPNMVQKMFLEAVNNVKGNQLITSQEELQSTHLMKEKAKTEEPVQQGMLKRITQAPIQLGRFMENQAYKMVGGDELMDALSQHLREIGVNATLMDRWDAQRIIAVAPRVGYPLGYMRVKEKNFDFIQVSYSSPGSDESRYRTVVFVYSYVVLLNAYNARKELEAYFGSIERRKGFFTKEVEKLGFQWEGGKLAEVLSKDAELNKKILDLKLERLEIRPGKVYLPSIGWPKTDKTRMFVLVTPMPPLTMRALKEGSLKGVETVGRDDFPTREAFDVYDKIAWHIRSTSESIVKERT